MEEKAFKEMCKWAVDHGKHPLTQRQKEVLKIAIEQSKTLKELLIVAMASGLWG
jgi:DNA-binding CsgD family transcriptional regulator